jgi:formate dehydrogenase subunit gamma
LGDFFGIGDLIGFGLPAELSALQQLRLAHAVHAVLAILMIVVAIVHVYLGSVGMEGAIDAMVSGHVDENLAREHHSLWVAELGLERPPERIALPEERDTPVRN